MNTTDPSVEQATHWDTFKSALLDSLSNMDAQFFAVPRHTDDGIQEVQRERVYCYELYHQLRRRLGDNYPYVLHGELDKRGQSFISDRMNMAPIPDFVVHRPGHVGLEDQLVAIEVKSGQGLSITTGQQDVNKLASFVENVGYLHGILLVFGSGLDPQGIARIANTLDLRCKHIHLLWHSQVGLQTKILRSSESWPNFDKHVGRPGPYWRDWRSFPQLDGEPYLHAPFGPGVYELRHRGSHLQVLIGSGKNVAYRMTSLLPVPFGQGNRNNHDKRQYVLEHLDDIEYRTMACASVKEARQIEHMQRSSQYYRFPT